MNFIINFCTFCGVLITSQLGHDPRKNAAWCDLRAHRRLHKCCKTLKLLRPLVPSLLPAAFDGASVANAFVLRNNCVQVSSSPGVQQACLNQWREHLMHVNSRNSIEFDHRQYARAQRRIRRLRRLGDKSTAFLFSKASQPLKFFFHKKIPKPNANSSCEHVQQASPQMSSTCAFKRANVSVVHSL